MLELGGKNPPIILEDADPDLAVDAAVFGAFMNSGQLCMSTDRIIIHNSLVETFIPRYVERVKALPVGDPRESTTAIGPLVNSAAVERVDGLVRDAVEKGARTLSGGRSDGPCFPPTVLVDVTPEMRLYSEESFGPVVAVVPVDGPDDAVRVANDTQYWSGRRGLQRERSCRARAGPADRERHLPHQRRDRPRRAADAVRRRQGERLRPIRRTRRARGIHGAAMDHSSGTSARLPDLTVGSVTDSTVLPDSCGTAA